MHIHEKTRAMKFQGCLPKRFWGICIAAGVYIINKILSTVLVKKTPYELISQKVSELNEISVLVVCAMRLT